MSDNYKTIFVLDHTQYFGISSEDYISIDFLRGKAGFNVDSSSSILSTSPQFSKSLWTCSVESSIEYCRIVWDLFPREKLVRFIVSDTAAHIVNTWNITTQNMSHVLNAMALVGVPQRIIPQSSDFSVIHGLRAAIEALAEPTDHQMYMHDKNMKVSNRGRVICITSARDNPSMKSLEDIFHTVLMQQNSLCSNQNKLLHIDHCHLVIINVVPLNIEQLVTDRSLLNLSSNLSTEIHTISAPRISNKLTHLIMSHYDLASTTVTGIPMKEEQNANSSANYDVEIFHARNAHISICGNDALLPTSTKEGAEYSTVTLKWCTPRTSDIQHNLCMAQHRVTPVDVTSRPSACLINFLLNGRAVLLEMPRKSGGKITSHLLSARGGEIFIHLLQITHSCLEDLPAISESSGGRAIDYRISDFTAFIKQHRFVPLKSKLKLGDNLLKGSERIVRRSRYFPLTLSASLVFNLQRNLNWMLNLLRKITKEDMDKSDEVQCQQYIYELYTSATNLDVLPFQNIGPPRLKGHKKSDQYKIISAELEMLIRQCTFTSHHKIILDSIQSIRALYGDISSKLDSDISRDSSCKNVIRATTDSPLSPPHSLENIGYKTNKRTFSYNGYRNLLEACLAAERQNSTKRSEFNGRICTPVGQIAVLYTDFYAKEKEAITSSQMANVHTNTNIQVKDETGPIKVEVIGSIRP